MNRVRVWLAALGLVAVAALPVAAQVQTGSILVRVTDAQGGAVPGVTVTLTSPVLVAGTMTGVTDTGGVNRFPSLQPGIYSVKVELQGFRTVIRENVRSSVGQTVPLDMQLSVATVAETVTVTGTSPVVDTTSANTSVNLSEQLLQGTPGGRDIWSLVEYKVPSLLITRPDVGGTSGGLQGVFNARGTTSAQNSSYLNGINVGDPAAIGAAGFYYDFDAFDDIQVSTGAHDITVPTSGVFLNMVTKSGGESWRGRTDVRVARRRDADAEHRRRAAALRLPSGNQRRRLRVRHQHQRRRSDHREQAAHLHVVPRLARARERAGGVLDAGARQDRHHVGPRQRQLPDQRQEPPDRSLLAAVLQEAESLPERVERVRCSNRPTTKTTCSTSTRCCGTRS